MPMPMVSDSYGSWRSASGDRLAYSKSGGSTLAMSSALADSSAGWPGPGEPSKCPVPLILIMNGYGSRRTYWLIASAPVLPGELPRRAEVPTPSQRAPRQRRGEVLAALVGEPRRGRRLVADQTLIGLRLEHVRKSSPGDDQCRGGDPVALTR